MRGGCQTDYSLHPEGVTVVTDDVTDIVTDTDTNNVTNTDTNTAPKPDPATPCTVENTIGDTCIAYKLLTYWLCTMVVCVGLLHAAVAVLQH